MNKVKEPQLYAVQKLRKIFAQIFTEKTFGSSINIYGFATTYNDGSGNRPKTSVLHATISLLHFQNCFDSFERMSQVQQPVFKRRVKALSKAGSFYQELVGREGRGGWVLVTQTGIERFFLFGF